MAHKLPKDLNSYGQFTTLIQSINYGYVSIYSNGKKSYAVKSMSRKEDIFTNVMIEISSLKHLKSEYVVKFYDMIPSKLFLNIILEEAVCGSLNDVVKNKSPLDVYLNKMDIIHDMIEAVKVCHANGILHRDIKPQNFLVCRDGGDGDRFGKKFTVKICDFGMAIPMNISYFYPESGDIAYTEDFRSPEIIYGDVYGYPSDVWALGCSIYYVYASKYLYSYVYAINSIQTYKLLKSNHARVRGEHLQGMDRKEYTYHKLSTTHPYSLEDAYIIDTCMHMTKWDASKRFHLVHDPEFDTDRYLGMTFKYEGINQRTDEEIDNAIQWFDTVGNIINYHYGDVKDSIYFLSRALFDITINKDLYSHVYSIPPCFVEEGITKLNGDHETDILVYILACYMLSFQLKNSHVDIPRILDDLELKNIKAEIVEECIIHIMKLVDNYLFFFTEYDLVKSYTVSKETKIKCLKTLKQVRSKRDTYKYDKKIIVQACIDYVTKNFGSEWYEYIDDMLR